MQRFYSIEKSPLYKISIHKLAAQLNLESLDQLESLASSTSEHYSFFEKDGRNIQTPNGLLKMVHKRLATLMGRIQVPAYLQSAVKGTSYIKNANQHQHNGVSNMFTMDIKNFFPSVSYKMIWKCFVKQFKCSQDVASILTKLCSINEHLPVGSSISTILSFYACRPMFDFIFQECEKREVVFTCYVDDVTCSGLKADRHLAAEIRRTIRKFGLTPHPEKTRYYKPQDVKMVTGIAVTPKGARLPNVRRKAIHGDFSALATPQSNTREEEEAIRRRLVGRLGEASIIEPRFRGKVVRLRKKIRNSTEQ